MVFALSPTWPWQVRSNKPIRQSLRRARAIFRGRRLRLSRALGRRFGGATGADARPRRLGSTAGNSLQRFHPGVWCGACGRAAFIRGRRNFAQWRLVKRKRASHWPQDKFRPLVGKQRAIKRTVPPGRNQVWDGNQILTLEKGGSMEIRQSPHWIWVSFDRRMRGGRWLKEGPSCFENGLHFLFFN